MRQLPLVSQQPLELGQKLPFVQMQPSLPPRQAGWDSPKPLPEPQVPDPPLGQQPIVWPGFPSQSPMQNVPCGNGVTHWVPPQQASPLGQQNASRPWPQQVSSPLHSAAHCSWVQTPLWHLSVSQQLPPQQIFPTGQEPCGFAFEQAPQPPLGTQRS